MPTLADIYGAATDAASNFKDRLAYAAMNPKTALQEMLVQANDRARNFNQLHQQSLAETRQGGFANQGPATQELNQDYANAGMTGMTVLPFGKARSVVVPAGQDHAAVNPVEVRARQAIDDLVNHARYFGVDSPINHVDMPVGQVMAHLDDYLGRSQDVANLPEPAKASLRNLWYKAEDAAKAYKRVYGEDKLMGKPMEAANESTKRFKFDEKKIAKMLKKGEWTQQEYDNAIAYNRQYFPE